MFVASFSMSWKKRLKCLTGKILLGYGAYEISCAITKLIIETSFPDEDSLVCGVDGSLLRVPRVVVIAVDFILSLPGLYAFPSYTHIQRCAKCMLLTGKQCTTQDYNFVYN